MKEFKEGQLVIYKGANGYEIGKIKKPKTITKRIFGITVEIQQHSLTLI